MKSNRQKHQIHNQTSTNQVLITLIRNYRSSPVDRERGKTNVSKTDIHQNSFGGSPDAIAMFEVLIESRTFSPPMSLYIIFPPSIFCVMRLTIVTLVKIPFSYYYEYNFNF